MEISVELPLLMTMAFTKPAKEVVTIHSHTIQHVPVFVPVGGFSRVFLM